MLQAVKLIETAVNATGPAVIDRRSGGAFQASIVGTGTFSCSVAVECSIDGTNWMNLGTIELSQATLTDGFASVGQWIAYRAVVSAVTGTVTSVVVSMSAEE